MHIANIVISSILSLFHEKKKRNLQYLWHGFTKTNIGNRTQILVRGRG